MKFEFIKWGNGEWAVQHPDATRLAPGVRRLGFGATKFQAVRDLEDQVGKLSVK